VTAADLLREAAAVLAAAGVEAADWDAERLLRHITGWDRASLIASPSRPVTPERQRAFRELVAQRARRVPLQYLVGSQAFWRHEFLVTPAVLIPRPETELLVEVSLSILRERTAPLVIDVGTGSGCIALSLAAELADARVHATDVSAAALEVARENARRLGLLERVAFHQADLLGDVAAAEHPDLVVSNPPYVDEAQAAALAPEIRDHEPALALFAGEGGTAVYRRLVTAAAGVLRDDGHLVLEIGAGQRAAVEGICAAAGLRVERVVADLRSIPRVLVAARGSLSDGSRLA
jgi:release factor glutamine methyltransferase